VAQPAIELTGVIKEFGGKRVLDNVDLTVPAGEITVLLGPSGAGKTVTISHIVGLIQPNAGDVVVEGQNLRKISEAELYELRRGMSVVLQGSLPFTCGLFYSLSVFENVAFVLRERTRMSEAEVARVTLENLGKVGLREFAEAMPDQLSAGMSKRVALARALALDARIVIIDDFDSGIDGVRLALLCDLIREAHAESGSTFLVTTHDMSAARKLADHAAVIHDGAIVTSGSADAVFGSEIELVRQLVTGASRGPLQLKDV
jgi:phospholipid/cholesterol/gamma-HCH transport system ATP-binding protein